MSEMLERVARAMDAIEHRHRVENDSYPPTNEERARAAIAALHDPPWDLFMKIPWALPERNGFRTALADLTVEEWLKVWNALVDALLEKASS